jgi:hypothetical protein
MELQKLIKWYDYVMSEYSILYTDWLRDWLGDGDNSNNERDSGSSRS